MTAIIHWLDKGKRRHQFITSDNSNVIKMPYFTKYPKNSSPHSIAIYRTIKTCVDLWALFVMIIRNLCTNETSQWSDIVAGEESCRLSRLQCIPQWTLSELKPEGLYPKV